MSDLTKVEWEPKYSVDIKEIDTHQKNMLEMFNTLIDMKTSKVDSKDCTNMVSDINEYAKQYFSAEERYMRKNGYPDIQAHSKSHRHFVRNTISLRREIAENIDNLTDEVILKLRNWLLNHILKKDKLFVPFIRINRYIDETKLKN